MSVLAGIASTGKTTGNDAGWALTFHEVRENRVVEIPKLRVSREQYYAEIDTTLPSGLAPGSTTITVEGLIDEHYAAIAQKDGAPSVVRLYLNWRDANASALGYAANVVGLGELLAAPDAIKVSELAVTAVTRRVGKRRYETEVKAVERAAKVLDVAIGTPIKTKTFAAALKEITARTGIRIDPHVTTLSTIPGAQRVELPKQMTYTEVLRNLEQRAEKMTGRYGRGLLLIRDGRLIFGPRPIPLEGSPQELALENGLLEAKVVGAPASAKRRPFELTLKGRPEIRPGDVISFPLPAEDDLSSTLSSIGASLLGSLAGPLIAGIAGPTTKAYVTGVQHKLGRSSAFTTIVRALELPEIGKPWDDQPKGARRRPAAAESPNGVVRVAEAVQVAAQDAAAQRWPQIGEVRKATTKGSAEPPSHTLTVQSGLVESQGGANDGRQLDIDREDPLLLEGVPYATPFAWGKCGLILPRYPGTRVVTVNRDDQPDDPIEIGALWQSGTGPDSEPGDWWLILPAEVGTGDRAGITDGEKPQPYAKKVTNDLIDADGNRFIEVGRLTVRAGMDGLHNAGSRPAAGDSKAWVSIEHKDQKTKLVVRDTGVIEIHAAGDLKLSSDADISLTAKNVQVHVTGEMNVAS